jgi:hypothetical protein
MALREVSEGAEECVVRLTYAPGVSEPIDVARCPTRKVPDAGNRCYG